LIQKLIDQASTNISLVRVPSHVGILGNETADDAAKEALNEEIHRNIYPTRLDKMDKGKTRTRTTRKMRKLDYNHERVQTTPHNEHISCLRIGYTGATHSAVMDKEPSPECSSAQ
jgi:hypothetical protein